MQIVNNAPSWSRNELTTTQHQHIRQTELSATLNITRIFMNETDSAAVRARDFGSVFYVRIARERTARSSLAPNFSPRATGSMFAKKHMFWCTLLRRVVSFFLYAQKVHRCAFPPCRRMRSSLERVRRLVRATIARTSETTTCKSSFLRDGR